MDLTEDVLQHVSKRGSLVIRAPLKRAAESLFHFRLRPVGACRSNPFSVYGGQGLGSES